VLSLSLCSDGDFLRQWVLCLYKNSTAGNSVIALPAVESLQRHKTQDTFMSNDDQNQFVRLRVRAATDAQVAL